MHGVPIARRLMTEDGSLVYDPEAIARYYLNRPFAVWSRFLEILWPLFSFIFGLWFDARTGASRRNQNQRAVQLRDLLTELGPAFIKVGQALSTRPDLVPPAYLEELTRLQDQLPAFPNAIAFEFIEAELGVPPEAIFAELSDNPVSAASLGQVYRGRLHTGEEVAVKVQRPGLAERIALDLYILRGLAAWAMRNVRRVKSNLVAIADEFGLRIFEELDYRQEADNAERFAELYGQLPDIYVPSIYRQYTSRRVLTMEWIQGTKLTELQAIRNQGIDPAYLIERGVQCSLRQLLEYGFFHADPHPGNLLATPDGQLAYLDFGMMSQVEDYQRYGLIEAVVHLVNRDFQGLARDYVKLEFLTPDTDLTPIIPALAGVFKDAMGASVADLDFKSITDQLSQVMYDYPFRVPAYYALIIRSLVTLEGIAINVDPNFKVLSKAYPFIARQILTDPSPDLRASLRELLFNGGQLRWNRLENLLRNASNSSDYDSEHLIQQTVDFLLSESGQDLRDRLVEELVNSLDRLGRGALPLLRNQIRQRLGMDPEPDSTLTDLQPLLRVLSLLQQGQRFEPQRFIPLIPVLGRPEVQQMGQQVVTGLAQKALVRFIREVVVGDRRNNAIAA